MSPLSVGGLGVAQVIASVAALLLAFGLMSSTTLIRRLAEKRIDSRKVAPKESRLSSRLMLSALGLAVVAALLAAKTTIFG